MIVILCAIFGAFLGGYRARNRGGNMADIAQYATAHAIAFALLGLFATIFIERML
ncbi:hypothetical protein [Tropicimonas sp.]|uniref:hypothetical protein n=1 Tax=Tropicimonas sp. TaxID=2067044 RepID=UPI003A8905E8